MPAQFYPVTRTPRQHKNALGEPLTLIPMAGEPVIVGVTDAATQEALQEAREGVTALRTAMRKKAGRHTNDTIKATRKFNKRNDDLRLIRRVCQYAWIKGQREGKFHGVESWEVTADWRGGAEVVFRRVLRVPYLPDIIVTVPWHARPAVAHHIPGEALVFAPTPSERPRPRPNLKAVK